MRIGTVDDFHVQETVLKPPIEQFTRTRLSWLNPIKGAEQIEGHAKF